MRHEPRDDLEWYEGTDKTGWHYSTISVVWTSGFSAQIVFDKEDTYFAVLYRTLYSNGKYDESKVEEFLTEVAHILGGHPDNRKNKAVAHLVGIIERMTWDAFKSEYISQRPTFTIDYWLFQ